MGEKPKTIQEMQLAEVQSEMDEYISSNQHQFQPFLVYLVNSGTVIAAMTASKRFLLTGRETEAYPELKAPFGSWARNLDCREGLSEHQPTGSA